MATQQPAAQKPEEVIAEIERATKEHLDLYNRILGLRPPDVTDDNVAQWEVQQRHRLQAATDLLDHRRQKLEMFETTKARYAQELQEAEKVAAAFRESLKNVHDPDRKLSDDEREILDGLHEMRDENPQIFVAFLAEADPAIRAFVLQRATELHDLYQSIQDWLQGLRALEATAREEMKEQCATECEQIRSEFQKFAAEALATEQERNNSARMAWTHALAEQKDLRKRYESLTSEATNLGHTINGLQENLNAADMAKQGAIVEHSKLESQLQAKEQELLAKEQELADAVMAHQNAEQARGNEHADALQARDKEHANALQAVRKTALQDQTLVFNRQSVAHKRELAALKQSHGEDLQRVRQEPQKLQADTSDGQTAAHATERQQSLDETTNVHMHALTVAVALTELLGPSVATRVQEPDWLRVCAANHEASLRMSTTPVAAVSRGITLPTAVPSARLAPYASEVHVALVATACELGRPLALPLPQGPMAPCAAPMLHACVLSVVRACADDAQPLCWAVAWQAMELLRPLPDDESMALLTSKVSTLPARAQDNEIIRAMWQDMARHDESSWVVRAVQTWGPERVLQRADGWLLQHQGLLCVLTGSDPETASMEILDCRAGRLGYTDTLRPFLKFEHEGSARTFILIDAKRMTPSVIAWVKELPTECFDV